MNLNETFEQEAERIIGEKTEAGSYFIIYGDIADFHAVNQFYGKEAGDGLLVSLEELLNECDTILFWKRIYADLFLGLGFLPQGLDVTSLINLFDSKTHSFILEQQSRFPACKLKIASGFCQVEQSGVAKAVEWANVARKVSKEQRSAKAVLYSREMEARKAAQFQSEQEIYKALRENRFCFHLQPKVDLTTGHG